MKQSECVEFLQWCLPRMRMRWPGFRRVRSQVCKRLGRRLQELGLNHLDAYRAFLEINEHEWARLDQMCRITISRFYRDRAVFEALEEEVLPTLARAVKKRGEDRLKIWSCGCASGEEPYTLAILWRLSIASTDRTVRLEITATDTDPVMLERARKGIYPAGSLRDLPEDLRLAAFEDCDGLLRIRDSFRESVNWLRQDVRQETPGGPFDLVLCRNLVLTYFDDEMQREVMEKTASRIRAEGALVVGARESLPLVSVPFEPLSSSLPIYVKIQPITNRRCGRRSAPPATPSAARSSR